MDVPAIFIDSHKDFLNKYTDPIDLSNACRAFYRSRLEVTRKMREKWSKNGEDTMTEGEGVRRGEDGTFLRECGANARRKNSLDLAIGVLRQEMATLMEQDLCLMKQLLTLNEEIEDLKWRRRHVWSRTSSFCSSDMIQSASSLGRVDENQTLKFSTPSSLSLQLEGISNRFSVYNDEDPYGTFNRKTLANKAISAYRPATNPISPLAVSYTRTSAVLDNIETDNSENIRLLEQSSSISSKRSSLLSTETPGSIAGNSQQETMNTSSASTLPSVNSLKDRCYHKDKRDIKQPLTNSEPNSKKHFPKLLETDMDSQDSGIHDCNSGSL
ncbi:uncharacterized protein T25D10.4-like [Physella acuta]|uniref:uncharacterized protein T25D10.4-like n=1 Tax=Physella acuta TaxID=109671 RepID=UPI0027DB5E14|nr:uncharacterized protein T25D10.4-like [Physella acuta]